MTNNSICKIYINGDKSWRLNGKLHRENGPAVEYANGDKAWYFYGYKIKETDKCYLLGVDSRGYYFISINDRIKAGCRNFTIEEAKEHWQNNPEALAFVIKAEQTISSIKE